LSGGGVGGREGGLHGGGAGGNMGDWNVAAIASAASNPGMGAGGHGGGGALSDGSTA